MANVVFIAYADIPDNHLPALKGEHSNIKRLFLPLDSKDFIKLVREENISTKDFINHLSNYSGQITLLHFSGHANEEEIELVDGGGKAVGLGQILDNNKINGQQQLRLVFLNGCATAGQVEAFLKAGVPAVIATSRPVFDRIATLFSEAFYRALTNKRSIIEAFNFAVGELKFIGQDIPPTELRGPVKTPEPSEKGFPWGLYVMPENMDAIHWCLPYSRESGLSQQLLSDIQSRVANNKYIVRVLDPMCRVNKDIEPNYLIEVVNGQERPVDPSRYLDAVIENFPWVIGSQVRLLRQKLQLRRGRLEQLISTYIISSQLAYYLLLSDCWQQKIRHGWDITETPAFVQHPRNVEELKNMDFCDRMLDVYRFMMQSKLPNSGDFFAPEMGDFCRNLSSSNHRLNKAYHLLEDIRRQLTGGSLSDWSTLCEKAEQALTAFLSELAFLAGYHFLTVRNIFLDFAYTKPLKYELEMGKLNALEAGSLGIYEGPENRRKDNYANSKSIVFTLGEHDLQFSLPLAPFLIDLNTYLQDPIPHLFLFAFEEGDRYYYYSINHDFFTAVSGGTGFDLIHTGLNKEDFLDGNNDASASDQEEDLMEEESSDGPANVAPSKSPVFTLLEEQHARFRSDFTPYLKPRNP